MPSCDEFITYCQNVDFKIRRDHQKHFLWASRLWVGRRKEPILGYVSKNYERKNSGSKGLKGEEKFLKVDHWYRACWCLLGKDSIYGTKSLWFTLERFLSFTRKKIMKMYRCLKLNVNFEQKSKVYRIILSLVHKQYIIYVLYAF